jgi:hypothetical protein
MDAEATIESLVTWLYIASVKLMSRLSRPCEAPELAQSPKLSIQWRCGNDSSQTLTALDVDAIIRVQPEQRALATSGLST